MELEKVNFIEFQNQLIQFIISNQNVDGSFSTYRINPKQEPQLKVKLIPDPSPFITANILFSLISTQDEKYSEVIDKGQRFLIEIGYHGFWRFWPKVTQSDIVPFDLDDTAICSFVLKNKMTYDNKSIILKNTDENGYFYTWLKPSLNLIVSNPFKSFLFLRAIVESFQTLFNKKSYNLKDKEPAVAANVLLYLGENASTISCIKKVILEIESNTFDLQFYEDEICLYYHTARAYSCGISSFKQLDSIITNRIITIYKDRPTLTLLKKAMIINVLYDFGLFVEEANQFLLQIFAANLGSSDFETDTYFCTKDRIFQAGSPVLTAALLVEAMAKMNRNAA
jgi:hypothetical protein